MILALFQGDPLSWNWTQFGMATGAIVVLFSILWFTLRIVPGLAAVYKEIKLAEINVREEETKTRAKEAESRSEQANGFTQLAGALSQMSGVIRDVVIEQRHETNKAILLARVSSVDSEQMISLITDVSSEVSSLREEIGAKKKNGTQAKESPTS